MHITLMAGERWAHWRLLHLYDLVHSLSTEGHSVTVLGLSEQQANSLNSECDRIAFKPRAVKWSYQFQYLEIRDQLRRSRVDLIHVLDPKMIDVGVRLATDLSLPVVVSFWDRPFIQQLKSITLPSEADQVLLTAPSGPCIKLLREKFDEQFRIKQLSGLPGIHRESKLEQAELHTVPSLALIHQGPVTASLKNCLNALGRELSHLTDWHLFLYAEQKYLPRVWKQARKAGLIGHLNIVESCSAQLSLLMESTLMVQTSSDQSSNAILHHAMSGGTVVAVPERTILEAPFLQHARQLWKVEDTLPMSWPECLRVLLHDQSRCQALSESVLSATRHWKQEPAFGMRARHLYEQMLKPNTISIQQLVA